MFGKTNTNVMRDHTDQYTQRSEDFKRKTRPLDDTELRKKQMTKKTFLEKYDRQIVYFILGAVIIGFFAWYIGMRV